MKTRMAVMKAKMRRLAELVLIGVSGMNISQVSFPNNAAKKKKNPHFEKKKTLTDINRSNGPDGLQSNWGEVRRLSGCR